MIRLFFLLLKNKVSSFLRRFYWLYNLSKSDLGKDIKIEFPIILEGKGRFEIGDKSLLGKKAKFGIAKKCFLKLGDSCNIESESTIILAGNSSLITGSAFKLGARSRMYVKNTWHIGNNVKIATNTAIFSREPDFCGKLSIGNDTNIGDNTIIDVVDDIIIGHNVAIGPNCTIYTHDHIYTDKSLPAWKGGVVSKSIYIEDGAWIGSNVTILPGVCVGKRAVVAAGSVVTKNVESETIFGGVPAKKLKSI